MTGLLALTFMPEAAEVAAAEAAGVLAGSVVVDMIKGRVVGLATT